MALDVARDLLQFVHRAGSERSGVRVVAELCRRIGSTVGAKRVSVFRLDDGGFVPHVSEYPSGEQKPKSFAAWKAGSGFDGTEIALSIRLGSGPIHIDDPSGHIGHGLIAELDIGSMLAVPLRIDSMLYGAMLVEGDAGELAARESEIVDLAIAVSLALESAVVTDREAHRAREAEALLSAATALAESTELSPVLASVAINSARATGTHRCSILTRDGSGGLRPVMSQYADGHEDADAWARFRSVDAVLPAALDVMASGEPAVFDAPESAPDQIPPVWIDQFGVKTILIVPLAAWGETFGVLLLDHETRRPITSQQIRVATGVARYGAAAIGLARSLEKERASAAEAAEATASLRKREARERNLTQLSRYALSGRDPDSLMRQAIATVTLELGLEIGSILKLRNGTDVLSLHAGVGWGPGAVGAVEVELESLLPDWDVANLSREATVVREAGDLPPPFADAGAQTGVYSPLGAAPAYGILAAHSTTPRSFSSDDVEFVEAVANVLTLAVDRYRADTAVRESELRYQALYAAASDAIVTVDAEQQIVLFNKEAEAVFGYDTGEVLGQDLGLLIPEQYRAAHVGLVEDYVYGPSENRRIGDRPTLVGCRKNGEEFPAEITVSRLELGAERLSTAIVRDVSKRVLAENALQESEERYRTLFERSPVAIWQEDFSAAGRWLETLRASGVEDIRVYLTEYPEELDRGVSLVQVLDANEAAVKLTGAESKSRLLGAFYRELVEDEVRTAFIEQFAALWEGRDRTRAEFRARTFDGEGVDCVLHWTARRVNGGLDLGSVIVAIDDITERRAAERRMAELARSKDELVASVSHEIRTPLTSVVGFAQLLHEESGALSEVERTELLKALVDQSIDVANIVDDLLVAAMAEVGPLSVAQVPVDLREEAAQVLETWADGAAHAVPLSGAPIRCVGDPSRVRQVVRNLVSNAFRYGGSNVRMEVGQRDGAGFVFVADDGEGLEDADRDRVFEVYERGPQQPGLTAALGVGLGIARRLARLMEGELTYARIDGESRFELSLPLAAVGDVSESGNDSSEEPVGGNP
ncbi:MAG: PAS domain S-box protein [Acidimicrobiia bacterium]